MERKEGDKLNSLQEGRARQGRAKQAQPAEGRKEAQKEVETRGRWRGRKEAHQSTVVAIDKVEKGGEEKRRTASSGETREGAARKGRSGKKCKPPPAHQSTVVAIDKVEKGGEEKRRTASSEEDECGRVR